MTDHDYAEGDTFDVTADTVDLYLSGDGETTLQAVALDRVEVASVDGDDLRVRHVAPTGENVRTLGLTAADLTDARGDWLAA